MSKYIELPREKIKFCGNTEEEKKANELIFDLRLENDSLQQEIQQLKEQNEELFNKNHELRIKLEHHIPEEQYNDMFNRKNEQLKQKDKLISEMLNIAWFNSDCPYSLIGDGWLQELCDCDNCQDTYKECWLKYFKNKCKGE